jgi:hypothetical protein
MKKSLLFVLAICLLGAAPAMAKEGFYIGAFYPTESINGDAGNGSSSGGGWGLRAGAGMNRYFAFEAHYSDTKHNSVDLKSLAGDAKLSFPLTTLDSAHVMSVEPYAMAGFAHYESGNSTTVKSDGFQWGIGVELYLFKELSVNAGWTTTNVKFDSATGDVRTVDFGLIYHFL